MEDCYFNFDKPLFVVRHVSFSDGFHTVRVWTERCQKAEGRQKKLRKADQFLTQVNHEECTPAAAAAGAGRGRLRRVLSLGGRLAQILHQNFRPLLLFFSNSLSLSLLSFPLYPISLPSLSLSSSLFP